MTSTKVVRLKDAIATELTFVIPTQEYRSLPIPGVSAGKLGDCFVKVTELPPELEQFMEVNPRVPNRNTKGLLSGPVAKGITATLLENPDDMPLKNQGIYLLVESAEHGKAPGGQGLLTVKLNDKARHGIVNGGHTFAAIRQAIESADEVDLEALNQAYVRVHLLSGIDPAKVPEMAEGLNRSKQVDDPSLDNLREHFGRIQEVMKGQLGEKHIAYFQGDEGDVYITDVLVLLEMFNGDRFSEKKHPHALYNQTKNGLKLYKADLAQKPSALDILVPKLPEILQLADMLRYETRDAAKRVGFEYGRMKTGNARAASPTNQNISLPFIGKTIHHRVPNGWLYPMLAAFRANVNWDSQAGTFTWKKNLSVLVPAIIDDLVGVCVTAHKDNIAPDKVGKRESIYEQCYDKVQLHLLRNK